MKPVSILERFFSLMPSLRMHHSPASEAYAFFKQVARKEIESLFSDADLQAREFKPFGDLIFPYHTMGAVDSLDLFDIDELIIFSFYWINRRRYGHVLDIGANIGLHSIILHGCGYEVQSCEPDPHHYEVLKRNLELNNCSRVKPFNVAVSDKNGTGEFIRVLGNTTGSHLAGSKPNPYGELDKITVQVVSIQSLMQWADLIKLDAEGHEKEILLATKREDWLNRDALVEIGKESNASYIYEHFKGTGVNLFSQKTGWQMVSSVSDIPTSYREGTLFISSKEEMPWG